MAQAKQPGVLPPFEGKALRDAPIPTADVWKEDEFGKAVLTEYNARVLRDFSENPFLKVFHMSGGVVHGSNPFAVCLVDMIVRPRARVATPMDLQAILDARTKTTDQPKIRGGYKDCGLCLRSVKEPNSYIAERVGAQLGARLEWPAVVCLSGLELVNDPKSPCGLCFKVTSNTIAFPAPVLKEKSAHFDDAHVDPKTGLPTQTSTAGRYFYSTEEGLARLYLGRGSSIDTIWDELGSSQADGRVVFCSNVIPPQRLSTYLQVLDSATSRLG